MQVLSIPHVCLPDSVGEMRPRVGVIVLLLGAAVVDTVVEYDPWNRGVAISLAHVCILSEGGVVRFECVFCSLWIRLISPMLL